MITPNRVLAFVLILQGFANDKGANGQGATPAIVAIPNVQSNLGQEARLSCAISKDGPHLFPELNKLRFCVWERLQEDKNANTFIVNFNEINSQPGLYSGMRGYSYTGEGFPEGECGRSEEHTSELQSQPRQCTLITDDKVYRGYVQLGKEIPSTTTKKPNTESNQIRTGIASSRTATDEDDDNYEPKVNNGNKSGDDPNRPRPIITSYNDARAIIQPEIIVQSTSGEGGSFQEVKVESAGLQIKPRRQGKLIVFE